MLGKKANYIHINYHWLALSAFFILLLLVHRFVLIYGDDYYHSTAVTGDLNSFISFHIHHYLRGNGRALIHFFLTLVFIGYGVDIWRIVSPLMFVLIVLLAAKTFTTNKSDFQFMCFIMCLLFLCLGGKFTSYSIYTVTPVFNYLYPFILIFLLVNLLLKSYHSGRKYWIMPVIGFLAGASMEQTGMIAIGYITLFYLSNYIFHKQKPGKDVVAAFFTTILGYLTVILAPGNFVRMENSTLPFMENFVAAFTMLINIKSFVVFNIIMILCLCFWLISCKPKRKIIRLFHLMTVFGLVMGFFLNVFILFNHIGIDFHNNTVTNIGWRLFDSIYIFSLIYVPLMIAYMKKNTDLLIHMIIALGSIFILLFASVSEYRPLTPAVVVFFIFISLTILEIRKKYPIYIKPIIGGIAALSLAVFCVSTYGYYGNYQVYEENLTRIEQFKKNNDMTDALYLKECFDLETAGYSINRPNAHYSYPNTDTSNLYAGYAMFFKTTYGLPAKVEIVITDQ